MTSYPGSIPSLPRPGGGTTMDAPGYTGSGIIDGISDELEAIATELGTDPSGASATVKARLDAVDTALAGKETAGAAAAAYAAAVAASQPLDSDLTAIAALSTTTFGRSLLTLADAAAGRTALGLGTAATSSSSAFDAAGAAAAAQAASQPLDSDLTAIAALTTTSFGRALLTLADAAALTASIDTFTSSLKGLAPASGGGTANFLRADGTWAAPGGSSGYATIKDEGSSLTARTTLDLLGPGVSAVDNSGSSKTDVSIMGFWDQPTAANHVVFPSHAYSTSLDYATINDFRAARLWLKAGTVFKGVSSRAKVADATCTLRIAVYSDASGLPSSLYAATEVSLALSSTSITTTLFSSTWTVPSDGWYWIASILDGGSGAPSMYSAFLAPPAGTATASTYPTRNASAYRDLAYTGGGALPATFTGATASTNPTLVSSIYLVRN